MEGIITVRIMEAARPDGPPRQMLVDHIAEPDVECAITECEILLNHLKIRLRNLQKGGNDVPE